MSKMADAFTQKCINPIRLLSADMVEKANSGHPGAYDGWRWFHKCVLVSVVQRRLPASHL